MVFELMLDFAVFSLEQSIDLILICGRHPFSHRSDLTLHLLHLPQRIVPLQPHPLILSPLPSQLLLQGFIPLIHDFHLFLR